MSPDVDSLLENIGHRVRLTVPSDASEKGAWVWALNTAIQQVCENFDALPKLQAVTIRGDSSGAALNTDFLRIAWVQKIIDSTLWVPMGEIKADTVFLQVVDTADAKLNPKLGTAPRLYYTHGVSDTSYIYTYPKYAKDTFALELNVAYWARDAWLRPGTTDDTTLVMSAFRDDVIELAGQIILRSRGIGAK